MGPMTAVFVEMAKWGVLALAVVVTVGSLGTYFFLKKVSK